MLGMLKLTIGMMALILAASGTVMSAGAAEEPGSYAELPGVKLWFTDTGGSGVPLVLLHANTGTSAIWEPQVGAFARAGYRVIALDRKSTRLNSSHRSLPRMPSSA